MLKYVTALRAGHQSLCSLDNETVPDRQKKAASLAGAAF
jgi:hypothetical protein